MRSKAFLFPVCFACFASSASSFGVPRKSALAFAGQRQPPRDAALPRSTSCPTKTVLSLASGSASTPSPSTVDARRRVLLSRDGPYFALDRSTGQIEFGATARLVTQLNNDNQDRQEKDQAALISNWLRDEQSFATSIWREDLIEAVDAEKGLYRLQLMTLQFVTLQLSPWVELRMKTVSDSKGLPVFTLQSVAFDPNVQILPGMRISAESLGIVIEVAGQLRGTKDGTGVTGKIAFQTTGNLPAPLRLLPDAALKAASDTINETVVNFAVQSFQSGAIANYQKYLQKQRQVVV